MIVPPLIVELQARFAVLPVDDVAFCGDCIVIPGEELDLDWLLVLLEEGFRFEGTLLDGHAVVLVQLKPVAVDSGRWKGKRALVGGSS